jgi:hypothetical protein
MDWKVIALRNVAFRKNLEIFGAYVSERPVLPELFSVNDLQRREAKAVKITVALNYSRCYVHFYHRLPSLSSVFALNLNLDCPSPWICSRFECLHSILQLETMGNQLLHVNDTALHKSDSSWPGIAVSVLKL